MPGVEYSRELSAQGKAAFVLSASADYTDKQECHSYQKEPSNLASPARNFLNRVHTFLRAPSLSREYSDHTYIYLIARTG